MLTTTETLTIQQGATFQKIVNVVDADGAAVNLTGFLGRGQIRDTFGGTLTGSFTVTITDPTDPLGAEVTITLLPSVTAAFSWEGAYFYDIEVYSGVAIVYRILQGRVLLSEEVTT